MIQAKTHDNLSDKIQKLKSGKAKNYCMVDFGYPAREQARDKYLIELNVREIEKVVPQIMILVKKTRSYFDHIADQNCFVASYLLINKAIKSLNGVLDEAKKGNAINVVELSRSGQEALDLVFLFLDERGKDDLSKWFQGEIIKNEKARKVMEQAVNGVRQSMGLEELSVKEMKSDIYKVYSLYTHSAYSAVFDHIDVFHEDFDFANYAGFHYSRKYFHLVENLVVSILLALKNVFSLKGDWDNLAQVEQILTGFSHHFANTAEIEKINKEYQTLK